MTEPGTPDDDLEWGDPPPAARNADAAAVEVFVAKLKARPGEWAKCPDNVRSSAKSHPGTEWTRRDGGMRGGDRGRWARWVGEP